MSVQDKILRKGTVKNLYKQQFRKRARNITGKPEFYDLLDDHLRQMIEKIANASVRVCESKKKITINGSDMLDVLSLHTDQLVGFEKSRRYKNKEGSRNMEDSSSTSPGAYPGGRPSGRKRGSSRSKRRSSRSKRRSSGSSSNRSRARGRGRKRQILSGSSSSSSSSDSE